MSDELAEVMEGTPEGEHFHQPDGNMPTDDTNGWRPCSKDECTWHGSCIAEREDALAEINPDAYRWVFETVFAPGTTREQATEYADRLMALSKQLGIEMDVHGDASVFSVRASEVVDE